MDPKGYGQAIGKLKEVLASQDVTQITKWRDEVLDRFQRSFSSGSVPELREEEFRAFLIESNNHHWSGLQRLGPMMCSDMSALRRALTVLLDETDSIEQRLDQAIGQIKGLGTAVATAVLLVAYPERYGVWNKASEGGLKALELWPHFERGEPVGERYSKVNHILNRVASDVGADLWTLDMLWWSIQGRDSDDELSWGRPQGDNLPDGSLQDAVAFGLERHLHDFLRDNWPNTPLGKEWDIYSEPGDPEKGYEYPCGVGRIDLLARHKEKPDWLVIELKRGQSSDATVGQLLRYMGWVRAHLSQPDETVCGLIIAHDVDDPLRYALSNLSNVSLRLYEVNFHLHAVSLPGMQR